MKRVLLIALLSLSTLALPGLEARPAERVQFRGVCQSCGRDLLAYYRPVACQEGGVDWQWVRARHQHCRSVEQGRRKADFFHSHWMNPANPKRGGAFRFRSRALTHPCWE